MDFRTTIISTESKTKTYPVNRFRIIRIQLIYNSRNETKTNSTSLIASGNINKAIASILMKIY